MNIEEFALLICIVILPYTTSQPSNDVICSSKKKCNECIQKFGCVWCADPNFKGTRCTEEGKSMCNKTFLENPEIRATGSVSQPLTVVIGVQHVPEKPIQISPQIINIQLRPNEGHPYRFNLSYGQANDYPVDLYYLMDVSRKDHKHKFVELGKKLADAMKNLTANFHLGFGSFVEKSVSPFVDTDLEANRSRLPCDNAVPNCDRAYSFRNHLTLAQGWKLFIGQLDAVDSYNNYSDKLNNLGSGLDAIMQTIVCSQIEWREEAHKLLVLSTDQPFHIAGDGKLASILKPNDECCHLDSVGMYTKSTQMDYPSVSQISQKVKEKGINLILAVTEDQTKLYELLAKNIKDASSVTLKDNPSNVVQNVIEQYKRISSSIRMREEDLGDFLRVKYFTKCLNLTGPPIETNACDELEVGKKVNFVVELELLQCPPDRKDWEHSFSIQLAGVNESMRVNVRLLCDCDCSASNKYEQKSPRCSYHGNLVCGLCECINGYSGEDCNCTGDEADKTDKCRQNSAAPICSDHGVCKCNKCHCNSTEGYWDTFCQCDNFTCPRVGGNLCSGHGDCVCGKCHCKSDWIDEDCSCENSTSNCIAGNDSEICSGHGTCKCNKCVCNQIGGYFGKFCEKCPTCSDKCKELRDCVECKVYNTSRLNAVEDCSKCTNTTAIEVRDSVAAAAEQGINICPFYDDQKCKFTFTYVPDGVMTRVTAQKNKECPSPPNILSALLWVTCSIVFVGLAILSIWKFYTVTQDRRECAQFEKDRLMAKWGEGQNPIYKEATSTFKNPTYCET